MRRLLLNGGFHTDADPIGLDRAGRRVWDDGGPGLLVEGIDCEPEPEDDDEPIFRFDRHLFVTERSRIEDLASRARHLERGWCWRADIDGEPAIWGIVGHVTDEEAVAIVEAYEGEPIAAPNITRDYRRSVPCRRSGCDCDGGGHLELAAGPGRGATAYTWVEVAP